MLGIRSKMHVSDGALKAARRLLAIGCFCIGTNQVDLEVRWLLSPLSFILVGFELFVVRHSPQVDSGFALYPAAACAVRLLAKCSLTNVRVRCPRCWCIHGLVLCRANRALSICPE